MKSKLDKGGDSNSLNSNSEKEIQTLNIKNSMKKRSLSYRWENSRFLAVRISYKVLHSIWIVVMAVGMFLAWLIAILAT
ncbi:hypothetical protein [Nonlabens sp.]|uniref:hypothetical protein n=1 Tax=Nonlabens sp. TaxID=1888209 RepID=UPI003F69FA34